MTHLFHNLLDNSIKYHREDIPPEIILTCIDKGTKWEFSIIDNGQGIQKQYFDRIFLLYQRLHPKSQYPGTGMGLAIVKKIILNIGGEIWLESEVDKGSIFYFTIPKN
jgi:signal transduction histidine kinase